MELPTLKGASITKELLHELYVVQGLSYRKCAEVLGLPTYGPMSWYMKKFGIKGRDNLIGLQEYNKTPRPQGRDSHAWKGGLVKYHCAICGKIMVRFPSLASPRCQGCKHYEDLQGRRSGQLLAMARSTKRDAYGRPLWHCLCDCGNEVYVRVAEIKAEMVKSCGCIDWSGENSPRWKPDRDARECAFCGKHKRLSPSQLIYGNTFCDKDCYSLWLSSPMGHFWKGGKSGEPYCYVWATVAGRELKEQIKERDGHVCQNPHCNGKTKRLLVHHIDYNKKNCHPNNLVTLCWSCNSRANHKRFYWQTLYSSMIDFRAMIVPFEVGSSGIKEVLD